MTNYCPQCGTKVAPGTQVCPQCGTQLKLVFQSNSTSNYGAGYNSSGIRKRDHMMMRGAYIENPDPLAPQGMSISFNSENTDIGEVKLNDEDGSIYGVTDEALATADQPSEQDIQKEMEQQNKISVAPSITETLAGVMESSKYRIVTQPFDKKTGFNAVELESKLNMYAKMGYHIVPNTMICQPGQDFFALMEKTSEVQTAVSTEQKE